MLTPVGQLPWLAIAAAFVASMAVGMIWYARPVFGNLWMRHVNLDPANVKKEDATRGILLALLMALAMSIGFAIYYRWSGAEGLFEGLLVAFVAWVAFALPLSVVHPTFEGRSLWVPILYLGHHLLEFLLYGVIFGLLA